MTQGHERVMKRMKTGIPGLDSILRGGLPQGGLYIIMGEPGAGKTIMANQMCVQQVSSGGRALYITLLAETHARMLMHLKTLTFFDEAYVAQSIYYLSGFRRLQEGGLDGLLQFLREAMQQHRPTLLVLDGTATLDISSQSELQFKQFFHEVQILNELYECTTLFLSHSTASQNSRPEHTMVDGIIELRDRSFGVRVVREIEIRKLRGTAYMRGTHMFRISHAGITVFPRTEELLSEPGVPPPGLPRRQAFGIASLDVMIHSGLPSGSSTLLLGPSGAGKTLLGLHFLAQGAREQQQGLYFGFNESPPRLVAKANQIGLAFDTHLKNGFIELIWRPPVHYLLDELAHQLLTAVRQRTVTRLFIDGLRSFAHTAVYPERLDNFFTALSNELRAADVTMLCSLETSELLGPTVKTPIDNISAIMENLILLRQVELRSQRYRLISVLKMRESRYDPAIREFKITEHGIEVATTFDSAEAILTGTARSSLPGWDSSTGA